MGGWVQTWKIVWTWILWGTSRGGHFKSFNSPLVDGLMAFVFEETPGGARKDTSSTRAPI